MQSGKTSAITSFHCGVCCRELQCIWYSHLHVSALLVTRCCQAAQTFVVVFSVEFSLFSADVEVGFFSSLSSPPHPPLSTAAPNADELKHDGFEDNVRKECVMQRWHSCRSPRPRFPAGWDMLVFSRGITTQAIFRDGTQDMLCNYQCLLLGSSFFPLYGDEAFKVFTFLLKR